MDEVVRTLVLNPCSVATAAAIVGLMHRSGTTAAELFNPWGVGPAAWLAGYVAVRVALLGFVDGAVWLLGPRLPPLPSRTGPKPVFQHRINAVDVAYLLVNSLVEYVFAQQIFHLLWHAPFIMRTPAQLSLLNGPVALWAILVADDALYAPLHRVMHHPALYKWVHKHHHRNTFPARGYVDAANEHPVEQIAALSLHWAAVHIVALSIGLHVAAVGGHFGLKALGACFNHTGYDVRLSFAGIDYSVRAHEMHHRKPHTNFAQYVMAVDRLMGTYRPYESGLPKGEEAKGTQAAAERLPGWADPAVEASSGHVVEKAR
jgi:sterol desaturase/sphingolipid hydroxylase (fatty acid hydroxylase superfamily)